jgi:hypothetical protein
MQSVKVPAFERFLHEMIPLAKAMGVGVEVSDDRSAGVAGPEGTEPQFTQHRFRRKSGFPRHFGRLRRGLGNDEEPEDAEKVEWRIVVKESRAAYRRPVLGDLRAICERPAQAAIFEFKEALNRYGKAKLKLKASIVEDGNIAVDVTAAFVVSR